MVRHQMKFQVIPDDFKKTWNEQEMRGLLLVSVTLQIVLSVLGNHRKHNPRKTIRMALWSVYSLAYAVIPVALIIPAQNALEACDNSHPFSKDHKSNTHELMFFWAQFLFLHCGGPDTITAYSLEDNKLWLRKMAFTVIQAGVSLYILLFSWPGCSRLPRLSILVYLAGWIKCFERIQALRLANTKHLRKTMLGPADPGPDYVKFLEEFQLKRSQGFIVKVEEVMDHPVMPLTHTSFQSGGVPEAYNLLQTFKRIFVGLILTYEDRDRSIFYFRNLDSAHKAFCAVEIELGFVYDIHYTKASVVYTKKGGLILRCISVLLILLVLWGFPFLIDTDHYQGIDIAITYLVIATEFLKEIFAFITMLRSDWTDLWLKQHNCTRKNLIFPFLKQPSKKRWSNSIAQLNLITDVLEEKPACFLRKNFFRVGTYLKKQCYEKYSQVSFDLKDMIYRQFFEFIDSGYDPKGLCIHKGSYSLNKNGLGTLLWSINEVEFDQSILIWHIATTLCYYSEMNEGNHRIESMHISDYLVNLLITNPEMLPDGIGMIRYRDTCAEAIRFFKKKRPVTEISEAVLTWQILDEIWEAETLKLI